MKIHNNKPPDSSEIYLKTRKVNLSKRPVEKTETGRQEVSDRVSISGQAKEIEELKEVINQIPEMRIDKIEEIKEAIRKGTYKIDSYKIAERMLEEEIL